MKRAATLALLGLLVLPAAGHACAVCFGNPDSSMTLGMNNAILTLLGIVAFVQVGFVALFVSIRNRSKRLRERRESFHLIDGGLRS